jgi:hypothetical protein
MFVRNISWLRIIYLWLYSPCGPWPLFQFLNLNTIGRTPWTGDQPLARPLPTNRTTQTENKRTQTSMPLVGFEVAIPLLERAKKIHALDRVATVIGWLRTAWRYILGHKPLRNGRFSQFLGTQFRTANKSWQKFGVCLLTRISLYMNKSDQTLVMLIKMWYLEAGML